METARLTKVEPTGKMWKEFHKIDIALDNGKFGTVNAKTNPPPYAVGDMVEIKSTWPDGNIRSIAKVADEGVHAPGGHATGAGSGVSHGSGNDRSDDIMWGRAANNAVLIYVNTEAKEHGMNPENIEKQLKWLTRVCYAAEESARKPAE